MKLFRIICSVFLALFMLASLDLHAGGKVSIQPTYYENLGVTRGNLSFSVYQSFGSLVAINSWNGIGLEPTSSSESEYWITSKNSFDFTVKRFTLSPGLQLTYTEDNKKLEERYFLKLSYQLW